MPIRIEEGVEPLSEASRRSDDEGVLKLARSEAGRLLRQELTRYCRGEINGRSFLIAGHRGAGKTTVVADAVDRVIRSQRVDAALQPMQQPVPVFLHGPSLFDPGGGLWPDPQEQAREALKQIILGLHREVTREFARAYRQRLLGLSRADSRCEYAELAAQFEIEIAGHPTPERLAEFWALAAAADAGVLARPGGSGSRELAALVAICAAYRRISGELSSAQRTEQGLEQKLETQSGITLKGGEFVRPIVSVLAGVAVAGVGGSLLGGLGAAIAASLMFSRTRSRSETDSRRSDETFMPDLSLNTLDRVLPTLLLRLREAGLAPVLVVDELDKVERLSQRIEGMVRYLKKLVAENVFTCFLTDRGYIEQRRLDVQGAYNLAYSYFSHPLLVSFQPTDFDGYLDRLLSVDETASGGDTVDLAVLKWVLRHRSELHALTLNREIALLRGDGGRLVLAPGSVRTSVDRIAVTFQVLIELQLARAGVAAWLRQRPERAQTIIDALYFLSRRWADGDRRFDWGDDADGLVTYLRGRMNLETDTAAPDADRVLPPDDLKLLKGLLDDMVVLLGPGVEMTTVQERWASVLAETGATAREGPRPEVFEAMLLGEKASLLKRPAGEHSPSHHEWRYRPSGVEGDPAPTQQQGPEPGPLERISTMGRETEDELAAALESVKSIRDDEGMLNGLLQSGGEGPPKGEELFELLAEKLRLLPTSPAWQPVRAAIADLQNASLNSATAFNLKAQAAVVKGFADMLKANRQMLAEALHLAGALAGTAYGDKRLAAGLRHALALMSEALRFGELTGPQIPAAMAHLWQEMSLARPVHDGWASLARGSVHAAFVQGNVVRETRSTEERGRAAWDAARAALDGQDVNPEAVSAAELIAALAEVGPYRWIGFHFEKTTLMQWSGCLLQTLGINEEGKGLDKPPPWVIAPTLRRLGAAALTRDAMTRIVDWLSPDLGSMLSDEPPGGIGRGGSDRLALCVIESGTSPMRAWSQSPRLGFAIAVGQEQARKLLGAPRFNAVGPAALIIRDGERRSPKPVLPPGAELFELWIYRRHQTSMRQPALVDPAGVDEVFEFAERWGGRAS